MYRIREIDASEEEDTLTELHRLTFFRDPIPSFWDGHWWFAYDGDDAIAFAGVVPSTVYPNVGYFNRVGVLPQCAGGLQVRFMRVIERRARKNGWERLVSDTTDNIRSANNFIRAGWKLFEPEVRWSFAQSLYWSKSL
jgi:Acetyltransferase (GNAT) family